MATDWLFVILKPSRSILETLLLCLIDLNAFIIRGLVTIPMTILIGINIDEALEFSVTLFPKDHLLLFYLNNMTPSNDTINQATIHIPSANQGEIHIMWFL